MERQSISESKGVRDTTKKKEREQTTIRLPAELKDKFQQEADRRGIAFNQLVLIILNEWVKHQKGGILPWKSDVLKGEKRLPRFCVKIGVADRC